MFRTQQPCRRTHEKQGDKVSLGSRQNENVNVIEAIEFMAIVLYII